MRGSRKFRLVGADNVCFFSHERISQRAVSSTYLLLEGGWWGSVLVFLKKHIATCGLQGTWGPDPAPLVNHK